MKVKELIELLQAVDPELEVVSPKDDEGNGWRWPDCVDDDCFVRTEDFQAWGLEDVYSQEDVEDKEDFIQVCFVG